jgi:hypothetical protein
MIPTKLLSRSALPLVVLCGMIVWFAWDMVFDHKVPFYRDLGPFFYPLRFILAESLHDGRIPLWNRHMAMGFPVMANFQSGAFYPPHALYLLPSFFLAVRVGFVFHYVVAAAGAYALCRRWGFPLFLSLLGSIVFTFGGLIVSLINLQNHFQAAVWLPWVILLGERAVSIGRWRHFLAFAGSLLLQLLAGSPEIFIMSLGLLFLDLLRLKAEEPIDSSWRLFLIPTATLVLVAGLAMVQILPTAELFVPSRWEQPVAYSETALYSMHPLNLVNLFWLDRQVETAVISGLHLFFLRQVPFLVTYYLGAISLLGLLLWMYYAGRREKGLILLVVLVSAVFAMGTHTPIYPFFYHRLPGLSLFRFTEKFFFVTYCLLLAASFRGLNSFLRADDATLKKARAVLFSGALFYLVPYIYFRFDSAPLSRFISMATGNALLETSTLMMTSGSIVQMERQLALAVGLALVLWVGRTGRVRKMIFQILLVAAVFIDLAAAHRPYQYLLDPDFVGRGPKLLAEPDAEPNRLFFYPGRQNLHPSYYNFLREVSLVEFNGAFFSDLLPNAGLFYGFDYMQDIDPLRRGRYVEFLAIANRLPPENQYRLLGALNVRYLVSLQPLEGQGIRLVRSLPQHPSWLYSIDQVVPRAYIVPNVVVEPNRFQVLGRLSIESLDPRAVAIIEEPIDFRPSPGLRARAEIAEYDHTRVRILASLSAPGVLVLADAFHSGWRVYVDGREERILRANFFFRAVPLPAGDHVVDFRYEPLSFQMGLVISLATVLGLVVATILLALRRRRQG